MYIHSFSTKALDVGGRHHALDVLSPGKNPGTRSSRGWVCSMGGVDVFGDERISSCPSGPQAGRYNEYANRPRGPRGGVDV